MKMKIKTIGAMAAACTLPIAKSHAWPVLTPEQLKVALQAIRQESVTRNPFPFKIEEIKYASDGMPQSIQGTGITREYINAELTKRIEPFSLNIKDREDLRKAGDRLEALSEKLSVEDLKKRGVDIKRLEELGIENVREITFNSILKSRFFTDEQRKKAKSWVESKKELEKAIESYAESYPYDLLWFECTLGCAKTNTDKINEGTTSHCIVENYCIIPKSEKKISQTDWRVRWGDTLPLVIARSLKNMLLYKNGKEKVILLLLLDEATPKERRLKWGEDRDAVNGSCQPNNLITFDIGGEYSFLSHEIGHYLQMHFGLVQTLENYQTKFAKQLLLLNNVYPEHPMLIPLEMREYASQIDGSLFYLFGKNYFECPEQLSLDKIFAYVQLLIRWQSTAEISNILGVYFKDKTLYLNALSDIRELQRIRYTHNIKAVANEVLKNLGTLTKEVQSFLQGVFSQASQMPLPKVMLGLLCQLHGRSSKDADNVVCDFDYNDPAEFDANVKPVISDLIKAE